MAAGSRIVVEDAAYGLGTIDGFRANVIGANNHSMVFDHCQTCPAGSGGCGACRKSLQLKGVRWKYWKRVHVDHGDATDAVELQLQDGATHDDTELPKGDAEILMKDGASHDDQAMGAGTRVLVEMLPTLCCRNNPWIFVRVAWGEHA
jgi:hypothetical protein